MKVVCIILCTLVLSLNASAQHHGTFDFLRLDMNARASALNGSFVSMTNDPNLVFYNPGALATLEGPAGSVSFLKHLLDINAGSLSYAQSIPDWGTFAAGISFIDYGSFDETDESMNVLGTFGASDLAVTVGWGTLIEENLSIGGALEFVHSSISGFRSSAIALGAGALYQIPAEQITLGLSIRHLGAQLDTYAGVRENLPLDITVGVTKRPEHLPVLLNLNFHKLNEQQDSFLDRLSAFSLGAEFLMSESVRLRVGFNNEQRRELKLGTTSGLAGFSFGGGILVQEYLIDYALNSYGKIGSIHRISVGMNF